MNKIYCYFCLLILTIFTFKTVNGEEIVDPKKTLVWGPGLNPDRIVTPARYFFIHALNKNGHKLNKSPHLSYSITIDGTSPLGKCRYSLDLIDRGDGSTIVRYKIIELCQNVQISIKYNSTNVGNSPYDIRGTVYSEKCYCPQDLNIWMRNNDCTKDEKRIILDLQPFKEVNFSTIRDNILKKFNMPGSVSLCNYVIKNNEIFRKCYGKYVGFKMFMDATLLSLTRLVTLPDVEFFLNLGDWPLVKKGGQQRTTGPYPIFSWCGSNDSYDIVLPTYDITESSLENMGRVMLDMLSVQRFQYAWADKDEKAFWRGRDSRRERLNLIQISKDNPDLFNASITNFFFFRDEENKYGPKVAHISFMDFFKYKYQINLDGTVAAYRLPYLLGGNSLVFKQDSPFYEHFYEKLIANKHFVPFKRDLSDLIDKVKWAKENDQRAKEIMEEANKFAQENLLPVHIYCYHIELFKEWSKRLVSPVIVLPGMEKVEQDFKCNCQLSSSNPTKDEL